MGPRLRPLRDVGSSPPAAMSSFRSLSGGNGGMDSLSLTVPLTPHVGSGGAASSGPAEVRLAGVDTKEKMYEPKQRKKLVRVLTVVSYLFFVSLAAAMLSLYYVFLWNPSSKARHPTDEQLRLQEQSALREVQRIQELRRQLQHRPPLELRQQQLQQLQPWTSTPSSDYADQTENAEDDELYTVDPPGAGRDDFAGDAVDNTIPQTVLAREPARVGAAAAALRPGFTALRHSSLHGLRGMALD